MKGMKSCFLVLKTWRFTLCLLLCFSCLPQAANAVDFYWYTAGYSSVTFSTPKEACEYAAQKSEELASTQYTYHDTRMHGARMDPGLGAAMCDIYYVYEYNESAWNYRHPDYPGSWSYSGVIAYRGGSSCPADTTFDPVTGECKGKEEDKCKALASTSKAFSKGGTAPDGYMKLVVVGEKQTAIQSTEGCFNGCLASTTDQKCTTKTSGAYFCRGTAWYTGQSCDTSGTTPGVDDSSTAQYPDPEQTSEEKPCTYTANADGTQSCKGEKSKEQDGQVCGVVSATGQKICVDKPPTKNGLSVDSTVKTDTASNGDKTTTKTDTATTTKCTDIKTCTSTTTTVTTVTRPNGSVSGSCSGANCPDKNTNPDADGDGFGDCVKGDCEGEEGSEVSGEACAANLMCSGDAIQCAILRKEKEQKCADEKFREVKEDELKADLNDFFSKPEYKPLQAEGDNVFDMGAMFDTSRSIVGSCPVIQDWRIEYGINITIPINQVNEKICPYYVYMGYLMVMFAMWRATEIVARGL